MADRFHVKTLTLENFRCFEKAELGPFDPHFNLLVGENGSGKSSVLVALADLFANVAFLNFNARTDSIIDDEDRRISHGLSENGVPTTDRAPFLRLSASASLGGKSIVSEDLIATPEDEAKSSSQRSSGRPLLSDPATRLELGRERDMEGNVVEVPAPLILLYTTNRSFNGAGPRAGLGPPDPRFRIDALADWSDAGLRLDRLREWFKTQTLSKLQHEKRALTRTDPSTPPADRIHLIDLVSNAVASAFEGSRYAEFDSDRKDIVIEFSDGRSEAFRNMSDGQRALVGLFADLAMRACILNAALLGNRTLEETPGLVLIDEIDLHLHPRWQRQIIGALKRAFPNIQFFASTHSPQVIGEARPEEIVMLTRHGLQERPPQSFGMDSNWILECVMRAEGRDPKVAKNIALLYDEIEDGNFDDARKRITRLRDEIGSFGDVEAAENYMWRVEHEDDEAAE